MYPPREVGRRSILSLAVGLGAGAAISVGNSTAIASIPAASLDTINGTIVPLSTIGTEPSAVLRRYANVFTCSPNPSAIFFRNKAGALKLAAACRGLSRAGRVPVGRCSNPPSEMPAGRESPSCRRCTDASAVSLRSNEPGVTQHFQMGGHGVLDSAQPRGDLAGGNALVTRLYKQAKHIEPRLLSECSQCSEGGFLVHIATNPEL